MRLIDPQSGGPVIATIAGPLERISEACVRVLDFWDPSCKNNPSCDNDEHECEDLDETNDVHAADSPFGEESMQSRDEADDSDGDPSFLPISGSPTGGNKGVLCKNDTTVGWVKVSVRIESVPESVDCSRLTREPKQNSLESENGRSEQFGALVRGLKVDLLPSRARYHAAELDPYHQSSKRHEEAKRPERQSGADAADAFGDGGRGREYPGADDPAHD